MPHMNFILGEDVLGSRVTLPGSTMVYATACHTILEYEFQLRNVAMRLVNYKGLSFY